MTKAPRIVGKSHDPQGLAARRFATDMIRRMLKERRTSDEALEQAPNIALADNDRALARAIIAVTFRRLGSIRHAVQSRLRDGKIPEAGMLEAALYAGVAQILFLDVPDHAAVDLAVEIAKRDNLAKHYAPLANALLRKIVAEKSSILADIEALPSRDIPETFLARWTRFYGEEQAQAIAAGMLAPPHVDLTLLREPQVWAERIGGIRLPTGSLRIEAGRAIPDLPGYAEGAFQVQDVASALPARLIDAKAGMRVLDLCAAPGGKSAQLAAMGAQVTAVERSAKRAERLKENLARLDLQVEIVIADAGSFTAPLFDAVLLDAPCSATGTARRHPEILWTKTLADILALARQQEALLAHAATLVTSGGTLVYATCSLEAEEGERQIQGFLHKNPHFSCQPVDANALGVPKECVTHEGYLRVLPVHFAQFGGADGFFAARLHRRG